MKLASVYTCDVTNFEIIRAEEFLQEINIEQLNYYSYCTYLRETHIDEHCIQENAPNICNA